jgi:hypothetical protein
MCILRDDDNIFYLKSYVWVARFAENIVVFISSLSFCLCLSSSKQRERERERERESCSLERVLLLLKPSSIINL